MTRVKFQLFGRNRITGRDFVAFECGAIRTLNASPDGEHLIRIVSAENNSIVLDNLGEVAYEFTVSGFVKDDLHVYTRCVYYPVGKSIQVNNNWHIDTKGPSNQMIGEHEINQVSPFFNIHFDSSRFNDGRLARLDVTIDDQETSSMFFTPSELLFISIEGDAAEDNLNHLMDHLIAIGTMD